MSEEGTGELAGLVSGGSRHRRLFYASLLGARRGRLYLEGPGRERMMFGTPLSLNLAQLPRGLAGPEATLVLRSEDFFRHCLLFGLRGLEDSHAHGDWESTDLGAVLSWIQLNREGSCFAPGWRPSGAGPRLGLMLERLLFSPGPSGLPPAECVERRRRFRVALGGD